MIHHPSRPRGLTTRFVHTALLFLCVTLGLFAAEAKKYKFSLPAADAESSLKSFAAQSGREVIFVTESTKGVRTPAVHGEFTVQEALDQLLSGTPLVASENSASGAVKIRREAAIPQAEKNAARATASSDRPAKRYEVETTADGEKTIKLDSFEVFGRKSLNMDLRRTRDDAQPYVVFERDQIDNSSATNMEEFFKSRLPMNTRSQDFGQAIGSATPNSSIDLRGLGTNQTLILVDGRRLPGTGSNGTINQPNINGIPLSAIERIEILPSTAGGIYGGSATGGVINIVMRRGYQGLEVKLGYGDTFSTSAARRSVEISGGLSLEDGRTEVMFAGSWSDSGSLVVGDRDFASRAIALTMQNNPTLITGSNTPPIGATVNIRSVSGNLVLDPIYGGTALNSNITHIPLGYAGPASDNGAALVARAGSYSLDLSNDLNGLQRGLVATPSIKSFTTSVRRKFGTRFDAFVDVSRNENRTVSNDALVPNTATNLPANAPNNPFQQAINVRFPTPGLSFSSSGRAISERILGGVVVRLPADWMLGADYSWSRSRWILVSTALGVSTVANTALNTGLPVPDGRPALNALQEQNTFPLDFTPYLLPTPNFILGPSVVTLRNALVRVGGPVAQLPAGPVGVSATLEHREEKYDGALLRRVNASTGAPNNLVYPARSQGVDSAYVEARVPLVAKTAPKAWAQSLELQVSARHEEYETRSDGSGSYSEPLPSNIVYTTQKLKSTNYTAGLHFAPTDYLTLRASTGTGFLPPTVIQTGPSRTVISTSVGNDPLRGGTGTYVGVPYTQISGGNLGIRPETSRSWSAGVIFTPKFVSGLRLSVDYTQINKTDEIQIPNAQFILDRQDIYGDRIVRGPNLPGDPVGWAGPIISFDRSLINIAATSVEAWDFQAEYLMNPENMGKFRWYAVATWQPDYKNQLRPDVAETNRVGFSGGPLKWRGNLGLDWNKGAWTVRWNMQFYDSYRVYTETSTPTQIAAAVLTQGAERIPSQIYHDLSVSYRFARTSSGLLRLFDNSEISLGLQNLFDKSPPIVAATSAGSLGYSAYGDPRLRRFSVSLRKTFN